jgi:molybdopterin converting factor small subunit
MKITVKLFAYFRDNRFVAEVRKYPESTKVIDVINDLDIDSDEIGITMINSRHCKFETVLSDGDILAIFPVIGGG